MRFTLEQRTTFSIRPDHYAERLLVGPRVEGAIVSGRRDHASAEARVVQAWLNGR